MKTRIIAKLLESESPEDIILGYTYLEKKFLHKAIANIFLKRYKIKVYSYEPNWCTVVCYNTSRYKMIHPTNINRIEPRVTIGNLKDTGFV